MRAALHVISTVLEQWEKCGMGPFCTEQPGCQKLQVYFESPCYKEADLSFMRTVIRDAFSLDEENVSFRFIGATDEDVVPAMLNQGQRASDECWASDCLVVCFRPALPARQLLADIDVNIEKRGADVRSCVQAILCPPEDESVQWDLSTNRTERYFGQYEECRVDAFYEENEEDNVAEPVPVQGFLTPLSLYLRGGKDGSMPLEEGL
jgi:hypothetical protein